MGPLVPVFHLFPLLPFELRQEIYILATPPRIVHVQESWDLEDHDDCKEINLEGTRLAYAFVKFKERYQKEMLKAKLHPDLAYFAHNWRNCIPFRSGTYKQMSLESYGFTSSSPLSHQPWLPTDDCPEIPLRWLEDHLDIAFELVRESYLYSKAPIPPLLHTCAESREVLMDYGYRIVFSTRTRGPRTWFHLGRDRLYVAELCLAEIYDAEFYVEYPWPDNSDHEDLLSGQAAESIMAKIKNLLPLLPNLEELLLEEYAPNTLDGWFATADEKNQSDCQKDHDNKGTKELWRCVSAEEIDVIARVFCCNNLYQRPSYLPCLPGYELYDLNRYKESGLKDISFYDRQFETILESQRDSCNGNWKVPRVKFVHTCSETIAGRFVRGRLMFWNFYTELKKAYAKHKPLIPLTVDSPTPPPPFREMDTSRLYGIEYLGSPRNIELRGWYLARVNIVEPTLEIM
ncbi:hypothetical protein F5Y06DRAFT_290208 [Hypoxylon sp. FL0890]|nr:hypothetical protein F5Y06DRAFT_290208 [Hypoxylon sp. FL0890]